MASKKGSKRTLSLLDFFGKTNNEEATGSS